MYERNASVIAANIAGFEKIKYSLYDNYVARV